METLLYCLNILKIENNNEIYRNALELEQEKRISSQIIINNVIFKIYRDILENYENFSHSLKLNFPTIVVDVISIINQGIDTKGTKVSSIGTEKYYQLRKQQSTAISKEEEQKKEWKTPVTVIATSMTTADTIHKERLLLSNKDLVERLAHITNRE